MFNNSIMQALQGRLDELNNSLRKIVSAASVHSYWSGRICRGDGGPLNGAVIRVVGLDSAGISFCVINPASNNDMKPGEYHFISFDSTKIHLSALGEGERETYLGG
jgi:hypothetical protein